MPTPVSQYVNSLIKRNESLIHYAEQKKPDTIKYVWFHIYEILERQNYSIMRESKSVVAQNYGEEGLTCKELLGV